MQSSPVKKKKEKESLESLVLVGVTSMVICRRETGDEGIIGEGNRAQDKAVAQETGHNPRLIGLDIR